jgi:hypothetical protein
MKFVVELCLIFGITCDVCEIFDVHPTDITVVPVEVGVILGTK